MSSRRRRALRGAQMLQSLRAQRAEFSRR